MSDARQPTEGDLLAQLRTSEERYRRIVEATSEGIWTIDVDAKTTFVNGRLAAMLGYAPEELVGKPLATFVSDERRGLYESAVVRRKQGIAERHEAVLKRKDGSSFWVSLQVNPFLGGDGQYDGALAIVTDITERKQAEEVRARLEGTLHATEERLRQAQKMEAIGNLAGGIAHDFNNILSVVLGYAKLIVEDLDASDPIRADLQEMLRAGERGAELTSKLLAFSRQQVRRPQIVDVNEVLFEMDRMLRRILGEDVELSFTPATSPLRVNVDPGQLEHVLMNLAVNARDAMAGGGRLTIELSRVTLDDVAAAKNGGVAPGRYALITLSDTGAGMDAATCARAFEPFFTTKPKGKGTGLGLATVYGIVQQSGGHIWLESEVGRGSTLRIYLPNVEAGTTEVRMTPIPPSVSRLQGAETVLLVEDEDQVRAIARAILRRSGYQVLDAKNGGEAFLLCEQLASPIHVLVTDVVMPKMSGRQLATRLVRLRPEMKVLYMSGYTAESMVHHGVEADYAFLQKPLTPETLLRKVREVLDT